MAAKEVKFSSSARDSLLKGVDTLILPWKPPADDKAPFQTLVQAIKAYPPGQGFVDGGGVGKSSSTLNE